MSLVGFTANARFCSRDRIFSGVDPVLCSRFCWMELRPGRVPWPALKEHDVLRGNCFVLAWWMIYPPGHQCGHGLFDLH